MTIQMAMDTLDMAQATVQLVLSAFIVLSGLYALAKVPAIWRQYDGMYRGHLLVVVGLGALLGGVHAVSAFGISWATLDVVESTVAVGVLVVIGGFAYIHPRLRYTGGHT